MYCTKAYVPINNVNCEPCCVLFQSLSNLFWFIDLRCERKVILLNKSLDKELCQIGYSKTVNILCEETGEDYYGVTYLDCMSNITSLNGRDKIGWNQKFKQDSSYSCVSSLPKNISDHAVVIKII